MNLFNLRKDFIQKVLNEKDALSNPVDMLKLWLSEAIKGEVLEPTAMTVSTVSEEGKPSSRVVLLKEIREEGIVFFTNYESRKGIEIAGNNNVAINFIWHELERQIRVEGQVEKLSTEESDKYYNMRPRASRIGAWASPQSRVIANRECLDRMVEDKEKEFEEGEIPRPPHWGGYIVRPILIEFWQGRKSRLHDRLQYRIEREKWKVERLAP